MIDQQPREFPALTPAHMALLRALPDQPRGPYDHRELATLIRRGLVVPSDLVPGWKLTPAGCYAYRMLVELELVRP